MAQIEVQQVQEVQKVQIHPIRPIRLIRGREGSVVTLKFHQSLKHPIGIT